MGREKLSINEKIMILELADKTGNISQVCRQSGVSRSQYYEYKRRFKQSGIKGLNNMPPVHKSHPQKTPLDTVEKIFELSLQHPTWGCSKLKSHLGDNGMHLSSPTIQRILIQHGMRSIKDRILFLEKKSLIENFPLNVEQLAAVEKYNPCYKERYRNISHPGQLLIHEFFLIGTFSQFGKVYLQTIVDAFSCYGFALLNHARSPESAVLLLKNHVFPFYNKLGLKVETIETSSFKCFKGEMNPYRLCLFFNNINHKISHNPRGERICFTERFYRILLSEFLRNALNDCQFSSLNEIQNDLLRWMLKYNNVMRQESYPNNGLTPKQIIDTYLEVATHSLNNGKKPLIHPSSG